MGKNAENYFGKSISVLTACRQSFIARFESFKSQLLKSVINILVFGSNSINA
jgi:hypothetical protein